MVRVENELFISPVSKPFGDSLNDTEKFSLNRRVACLSLGEGVRSIAKDAFNLVPLVQLVSNSSTGYTTGVAINLNRILPVTFDDDRRLGQSRLQMVNINN